MKVVIVGAGLAGSALGSALLQRQPDLELVIVAAPMVPGAAGIPAALCHPLTGWSLQHWEVRSAEVRSATQWLNDLCEADPKLWNRSPLVRPLPDDDRGRRLLRSFRRVGGDGIEFLQPEAVAERFADVGRAELGALVFRDAACVNGGELCRHIRRDLTGQGVTYLDAVVDAVDSTGVRLADGTHIAATRVAVCTGAAAGQLLPALGPVKRYFGELLFLDAPPPEFVVAGGCHVARAPDGRTVVGATWLTDGQERDEALRQAARAQLLERAATLMPRLRESRVIDSWGGVRGTFEGRLSIQNSHWMSDNGRVFAMAGFGATGLSRVWPYAQRTAAAML